MYILQFTRETSTMPQYFGPFASQERAKQYAAAFDRVVSWSVLPLIVPNNVSVKYHY